MTSHGTGTAHSQPTGGTALSHITHLRACLDQMTADHNNRVGALGAALGARLSVPKTMQNALRVAGRLHDLGKLVIPPAILYKPGPLSVAEFALVRQHPEVGYKILLRSGQYTPEILDMVLHHHERLDGSGYPDELAATEISLGARILAVADVWDALVSDRPYRAALDPFTALTIVEAEAAAGRLDGTVVAALADLVRTSLFERTGG